MLNDVYLVDRRRVMYQEEKRIQGEDQHSAVRTCYPSFDGYRPPGGGFQVSLACTHNAAVAKVQLHDGVHQSWRQEAEEPY